MSQTHNTITLKAQKVNMIRTQSKTSEKQKSTFYRKIDLTIVMINVVLLAFAVALALYFWFMIILFAMGNLN